MKRFKIETHEIQGRAIDVRYNIEAETSDKAIESLKLAIKEDLFGFDIECVEEHHGEEFSLTESNLKAINDGTMPLVTIADIQEISSEKDEMIKKLRGDVSKYNDLIKVAEKEINRISGEI